MATKAGIPFHSSCNAASMEAALWLPQHDDEPEHGLPVRFAADNAIQQGLRGFVGGLLATQLPGGQQQLQLVSPWFTRLKGSDNETAEGGDQGREGPSLLRSPGKSSCHKNVVVRVLWIIDSYFYGISAQRAPHRPCSSKRTDAFPYDFAGQPGLRGLYQAICGVATQLRNEDRRIPTTLRTQTGLRSGVPLTNGGTPKW